MLRRLIRRVVRGKRRPKPEPVPKPPSPATLARAPEKEPLEEETLEEEPLVEIETDQLREWVSSDQPVVLLDIREDHELRSGYAEGALLIRMNDIPARTDELPDKSARIVVYCAAGARSFGVTHWLREQGWEDAWSLVSGFAGTTEAGLKAVRPD